MTAHHHWSEDAVFFDDAGTPLRGVAGRALSLAVLAIAVGLPVSPHLRRQLVKHGLCETPYLLSLWGQSEVLRLLSRGWEIPELVQQAAAAALARTVPRHEPSVCRAALSLVEEAPHVALFYGPSCRHRAGPFLGPRCPAVATVQCLRAADLARLAGWPVRLVHAAVVRETALLTGGNKTAAAQLLGLSLRSVYTYLRRQL